MNNDQQFAWFRLFSVENFSAEIIQKVRVRAQMNGLKVSEIFELSKGDFDKVFSPDMNELYFDLQKTDTEKLQMEYESFVQREVDFIHPGHEYYPVKLSKLFLWDSPALLFSKGNSKLLAGKSAAIVGSRQASVEALQIAGEVSQAVAGIGWNVVSGYARGIDSEAHIHALISGGSTSMVLPIGINKFVVRKGFRDIVNEYNSLIISQFHPDSEWQESNGLERNKLMVGLSEAVIVIQAIFKGGSLYTGLRAVKYGVPLFVLAPKRLSGNTDGNAKLIAKGGLAFRDAGEIIEKLKLLDLN